MTTETIKLEKVQSIIGSLFKTSCLAQIDTAKLTIRRCFQAYNFILKFGQSNFGYVKKGAVQLAETESEELNALFVKEDSLIQGRKTDKLILHHLCDLEEAHKFAHVISKVAIQKHNEQLGNNMNSHSPKLAKLKKSRRSLLKSVGISTDTELMSHQAETVTERIATTPQAKAFITTPKSLPILCKEVRAAQLDGIKQFARTNTDFNSNEVLERIIVAGGYVNMDEETYRHIYKRLNGNLRGYKPIKEMIKASSPLIFGCSHTTRKLFEEIGVLTDKQLLTKHPQGHLWDILGYVHQKPFIKSEQCILELFDDIKVAVEKGRGEKYKLNMDFDSKNHLSKLLDKSAAYNFDPRYLRELSSKLERVS